MNTVQTFQRREMKYLLTPGQYHQIMFYLPLYMEMDHYGLHTICNLYYDTEDFRMIRRSLEKPLYKEKLRLRSYETPTQDSTVFLELKKKFEGTVYKRRAEMSLSEAANYLNRNIHPDCNGQVISEIDHVRRLYSLKPAAYISYKRMAYAGKEDPELRITFDQNILGRSTNLDLSKGSYGTPILLKDSVLMEVKISNAMPLWMSQLFSCLKIKPTSFSKYGAYYENCLQNQITLKGVMTCA